VARRAGGVAFEVGGEPPRAKPPNRRRRPSAMAASGGQKPPPDAASPPPLRRDGTVVLDKEAVSGIALPHVSDDAPAEGYNNSRRQKLQKRGERLTLRLQSSWSAWTAGPLEVGLTSIEILDQAGNQLPSEEVCVLSADQPDEELHKRLLDSSGRTTDPSEMWLGTMKAGDEGVPSAGWLLLET